MYGVAWEDIFFPSVDGIDTSLSFHLPPKVEFITARPAFPISEEEMDKL